MPQLSYFKVLGTWEPSSPKGIINGNVTFTMLIQNNGVLAAPTLDNPAVVVPTVVHTVIDNNTLQPVPLLANTAALNLTGALYYKAEFSSVSYREPGQPEAGLTIGPITFAASTDTTAVNLVNVTPAAGVVAAQLASILSTGISDATTLGRQLLTAPDAATALSDLGIGGTLALASTALQPSAVVNNADGTLSVTGVNSLEPLSTVTILTASTAPAIGQTTYYNATSGNLTPPLPALSGLRVGARLAVRRDPADVSQNTVTLTCAGSDTFYSSGATSTTLPMSGEQREYQVISVAGTKYYASAGSLNPVAALDQRYLAGASKLLNVADRSYATSPNLNPNSTSTVGTGQVKCKIGIATTGLRPLFQHWYDTGTGLDIDPAGPITFSASLMVISSSNPTTTLNTPYRLTFGGRTSATLDPGGEIMADPVGVSVLPGDVVATRTFLSSGTAYITQASTFLAYDVSFTATTDLTGVNTALGSGAGLAVFGPTQMLGNVESGNAAVSVMTIGDSAISSYGDGTIAYRAEYNFGGWQIRALSGRAGLVNAAVPGDRAGWFRATGGSFRRMKSALRATVAIIEYGANDFNNAFITAAALEPLNLGIATDVRKMGISRVYMTTIVPRTTSTDGWLTLANQATVSTEPQRVAYNTWVRAGCPIDPTTKAAVAVGTAGALTAGKTGHPITGIIDICSPVESSLNSGLWAAPGRAVTASISAGGSAITLSTGSFITTGNADTGGDVGQSIAIPGSWTAGGLQSAFIYAVGSTTSANVSNNAQTTVSGVQAVIGGMTYDGFHPSTKGHIAIAALVDPTKL